MSMFEMTADQAAEWGQKYRALVEPHVNGEPVVAAATFRRGGAAASFAISKAQLGGIAYAANKLFNKKKAGGLPERVMLAVTPQRIYAFKLGFRGRDVQVKDEVAVWERPAVRATADRAGTMTALTIESPSEGERATLVGIGVKDDPISQNLIAVLEDGSTTPA
jgi:hypothetical protein